MLVVVAVVFCITNQNIKQKSYFCVAVLRGPVTRTEGWTDILWIVWVD